MARIPSYNSPVKRHWLGDRQDEPRGAVKKKAAVFVAGGTGGHVFPAVSVALFLKRRGYPVLFITDERAKNWVLRYRELSDSVLVFPLKKEVGRTSAPGFVFRLLKGAGKSWWHFVRHRPAVVVGFGGYPSAAPVLAAQLLFIPTVVHECNGLLGRANAILRPFSAILTTGFPTLQNTKGERVEGTYIGNPLRADFESLTQRVYEPPKDRIRLLITGGSQGSFLFSNLIPLALEKLDSDLRSRLDVFHQVRDQDRPSVVTVYERAHIAHTLQPFFDDMPEQMMKAHLMIGRSGALTVTEIAAAGLPSVLIPLACSKDGDQLINAQYLQKAEAALCLTEDQATPARLAELLSHVLTSPNWLLNMSRSARSMTNVNATERLAQLIADLADASSRDL